MAALSLSSIISGGLNKIANVVNDGLNMFAAAANYAGTSSSGNLGSTGLKDFNMRLFGIPYQWNKYTDIRIPETNPRIGHQFLENFIVNTPIVTLIPGTPSFTTEQNSEVSVIGMLDRVRQFLGGAQSSSSNSTDPFETLRFYHFKPAEHEYNQQVNAMWKTLMRLFGFSAEDSTSGPDKAVNNSASDNYYNYSWSEYRFDRSTNINRQGKHGENDILKDAKDLATAIIYKQNKSNNNYVQFYIEPRPFTDTFSNTTNESAIANMVGKAEDIVTEGRFLFGAATGSDAGLQWSREMVNAGQQKFKDGINGILGTDSSTGMGMMGTVINRLAGAIGHVVQGDSIVFPKVYNSSSYSKSYEISINLESPYGDLKSYCTNILAPIICLLPMAAPKQTSANSYFAPWIVRAYCPGSWYCDMGIITSMSITRNSELRDVNAMGLPLSVKIDITIEDLYQDLMIPGTGSEYTADILASNRPLTQYLAVMTGYDLIYPDMMAFMNLKWDEFKSRFSINGAMKVAKSSLKDWLTVDVLGLNTSLY